MAEEIDRGSSDRQATWVALKTLRQRPTLVGKTEDGAAVYEVRSVRLVLTPGSTHFKRLVTCAKCGRDVPGSSVLAPADLDRPANPVFCDRCAQSSGPPTPEVPREREGPPAPAPVVASPVVAQGAVDTRRLAAVEAQLVEVLARVASPAESAGELQRLSGQVADLLRGQNAELAKLSASVAQVRAEVRELGESHRALALVQRDLDQRMVELESHPGAEIETTLATEFADVRASLRAMIDDGLEHLRSEVASLQQRVDDESAARLGLSELAESTRAVARAQGDLDQRLGDLAAHVAALAGLDPEAAGAGELAELRAGVAGALGAVESLEQRSRAELAAVAALLEAQRKDLTEALHDVAHETLMSMAEPLRDLTKAREDFERRLESLQHKAQQDHRRVEALNASATAGASRLHALEQKLHTSVQRLIHPVGANPDEGEAAPAPAVERRPAGALLESLERQLREAEERLGQL